MCISRFQFSNKLWISCDISTLYCCRIHFMLAWKSTHRNHFHLRLIVTPSPGVIGCTALVAPCWNAIKDVIYHGTEFSLTQYFGVLFAFLAIVVLVSFSFYESRSKKEVLEGNEDPSTKSEHETILSNHSQWFACNFMMTHDFFYSRTKVLKIN